MISLFLRSLLWFSASFLVLSVPVNNRPIFDHITSVFGPTAQGVIKDFGNRASETVRVGKKAIEQLFQTIPKNSGDKVEIRQSALEKEELPEEEYTIEEKQILKQILSQ